MNRLLLIFFSLFFLSAVSAQDSTKELAGIWKGTLTQGPGGCFAVYNIELQIQIDGTKISGASYHYSDLTNYVKEEFGGSYDKGKQSLKINELKVITFKVPADCIPCIKQYSLSYQKEGKKEILSGDWGGFTMNNNAACPPGKIVLSRIAESAFKDVDKSVPLTARKNELVREIKVDTGSIRLDFYDNAYIDGDTISVFVDKMPALSMKRLDAKPSTLFVTIDLKKTEHEVVMVAENLGEIPPNTALMIVTANGKRYQLYLTSDNKKNAMVRIVYEKPDDQKNNQ